MSRQQQEPAVMEEFHTEMSYCWSMHSRYICLFHPAYYLLISFCSDRLTAPENADMCGVYTWQQKPVSLDLTGRQTAEVVWSWRSDLWREQRKVTAVSLRPPQCRSEAYISSPTCNCLESGHVLTETGLFLFFFFFFFYKTLKSTRKAWLHHTANDCSGFSVNGKVFTFCRDGF